MLRNCNGAREERADCNGFGGFAGGLQVARLRVPPTRGNSGSPLPEVVGPRELLGSTRRGWGRPIETIPAILRAPKAEIRPKIALLWKVDVVQ